jgi:hypothetical protein
MFCLQDRGGYLPWRVQVDGRSSSISTVSGPTVGLGKVASSSFPLNDATKKKKKLEKGQKKKKKTLKNIKKRGRNASFLFVFLIYSFINTLVYILRLLIFFNKKKKNEKGGGGLGG